MSHTMGLAAPAYVEHGLSMNLLVSQCQLCHTLTSVFTHSDNVFLRLPCFLVPGNEKLTESLTAEDQLNAKFLWKWTWGCFVSVFNATNPADHVMVIAAVQGLFHWTQASYTLPHMLGERYLVVRKGKSFMNFPQATQHLAAMALSPEHRISPR